MYAESTKSAESWPLSARALALTRPLFQFAARSENVARSHKLDLEKIRAACVRAACVPWKTKSAKLTLDFILAKSRLQG